MYSGPLPHHISICRRTEEMAPKSEATENCNRSSLGFKPLPSSQAAFKTTEQWLNDKKTLDGAEGLWRIYDDLYDVTEFIHRHPGGRFWLETTKGTDVTEAFESHHISTKAEELLKKFHVRKAKEPRNSPYTFREDGFYKTLKRNAREALKTVPKNSHWKSHLVTDSLLLSTFGFGVLACVYWNYWLGCLAGLLLGSTAVAAHNYGHQTDNFRMYYGDIGLVSNREMRILHVLSHHMYTNSIADMQTYFLEPLIQVFPQTKTLMAKYGSWIYAPLILFPIAFQLGSMLNMYAWLVLGYPFHKSKVDFLPLSLPIVMYFFGGQGLFPTLGMWMVILCLNSIWYSVVALAGTHFHPDIFIDGDKPRPPEEMDWGIAQLDTVSERTEFTKIHFLVLITFGNHALHHLFPSMDHATLYYLSPVVEKTMKQFNLGIRTTNQLYMMGGFLQQLAKEVPNPNPPNLFVNCEKKSK